MLHLHSFLRWVILLLMVIAIVRSLAGLAGNKPFTSGDKKTGLFLMISCDLMLLIGIYLWISSETPWGLSIINNLGMSEVMKQPVARFFAIEHMLCMVIAIALVHIGRSFAKKDISDKLKHKRSLLFFGLALIIILISIPWPFREVGAGRGWF